MENFFKSNLYFLRTNKAMNQSDVGLYVNKKGNTIGYWEKGDYEPNMSELIKLAQLFDITINQLLHEDLQKARFEQKKDDDKNEAKGKVTRKVWGKVSPKNTQNNVLAEPPPDIVETLRERIVEKDKIIKAQEGQIKTLELAVSLLQQRLQAFEEPMQKTG